MHVPVTPVLWGVDKGEQPAPAAIGLAPGFIRDPVSKE